MAAAKFFKVVSCLSLVLIISCFSFTLSISSKLNSTKSKHGCVVCGVKTGNFRPAENYAGDFESCFDISRDENLNFDSAEICEGCRRAVSRYRQTGRPSPQVSKKMCRTYQQTRVVIENIFFHQACQREHRPWQAPEAEVSRYRYR